MNSAEDKINSSLIEVLKEVEILSDPEVKQEFGHIHSIYRDPLKP